MAFGFARAAMTCRTQAISVESLALEAKRLGELNVGATLSSCEESKAILLAVSRNNQAMSNKIAQAVECHQYPETRIRLFLKELTNECTRRRLSI